MPYKTNKELPRNVRVVLQEETQTEFRKSANAFLKLGLSDDRALASAWADLRHSGYQPPRGEEKFWTFAKKEGTPPNYDWSFDINVNCEKCLYYGDGVCSLFNTEVDSYFSCLLFASRGNDIEKKGDSESDDKGTNDPQKSFNFEVLKVDSSEKIVYGWAIVSSIDNEDYWDTDNEHIPEDVMRKAATDFMLGSRINNNDHIEGDKGDVGIVVHSFPLTTEVAKAMGISSSIHGWMVGVRPDKETLAKFESGEYKGFSIEGGGVPVDQE